jgi:multidrug efflux pump subunit AcrA (membrane-fusion protein)
MSTPTPSRSFTLAGRILLPLLLLGIGAAAKKAAVQFGRKAAKAPIETPMPDVELITATTSDYPVTLQSQGVIEAITQTRAAAEVVFVSPQTQP